MSIFCRLKNDALFDELVSNIHSEQFGSGLGTSVPRAA
ncbi:hypothetical protein QFZ94_008795 [Paraburkholderia sp. JPY465]